MGVELVILAAAAGYLVGSISFARLVTKILKPDQNLNEVQIPYDSGGAHHGGGSAYRRLQRGFL